MTCEVLAQGAYAGSSVLSSSCDEHRRLCASECLRVCVSVREHAVFCFSVSLRVCFFMPAHMSFCVLVCLCVPLYLKYLYSFKLYYYCLVSVCKCMCISMWESVHSCAMACAWRLKESLAELVFSFYLYMGSGD